MAFLLLVTFLLVSTYTFSQTGAIKAIEFFTQVIDGESKEAPFLIKRESYNPNSELILTEVYTKDSFLLSQKRVYDEQGLLTERLGYSPQNDKRVYTGKTRYYYDDAQNLTRTVTMNRHYYVLSRMNFGFNKRNEMTWRRSHFYYNGNAFLRKLEDFWFLSVVSSRTRFKYEYFSDRTVITEKARKPKQEFLWVKNNKGQLLDLFRIDNKRRRRMFKATYNAKGQKITSTFYTLENIPTFIGITGSMSLKTGDKVKLEISYHVDGRVDAYKQYLNGDLIGVQTLKYIY